MSDHVEAALERWRTEAPQLDASPLAVVERIARLSTLLEGQLEPVLAPHSLTAGELDVLAALRREGVPFRMTPTRLTASVLMTSGGMTKRLAKLEAAGLVTRVPDPTDRRSRLVELTEAGRDLVEQVLASRLRHEKRLLSGLRKRQRRDLAEALRDLCVALGDEPAVDARRKERAPTAGRR
jgi:DNA-binding MarR family transcriptional regulator